MSQPSRRHLLQTLSAMGAVPFGLGMSPRAQAAGAASGPPPVAAYGKLPLISNVALSPDGSRVCMAMNKDGNIVLYDYDLASGKASAAAIEGDKIRDLMWIDNQNLLVVTSITKRDYGDVFEENFGLMLNIPAGKRTQMYSFVSGVNQAVVFGSFYRIKRNGNYMVTAAGYKTPDSINMTNSQGTGISLSESLNRCLYAFNPLTSKSFLLDEDSKPIDDWVVNFDGKVVARSEYNDKTKVWTLRYMLDKSYRKIHEVTASLDMPVLCGLGRDGRSVLLYMSSGDLQNKYVEVSPEGTFGEPIEVNGANHYPIFSPTSHNLIGFGNDDGIANYVFYDPVFARLPALVKKAVGDIHADLVGFAEDPLHVVIFVDGEGNTGTYYAIDFTRHGYKEIGSAYPDLAMEWVADKTPYSYKAADGLEIPGFLTLPMDRKPENLALVVLPHGGPQSYDDARFDYFSQALSSRGYAVLQPNYRGSAGYGQDFTAKGYGEFGRKMQTDLSDGVRDLVKKGMVDPKRVAIFGGSYGGYAALAGVSLDPGVYNCAVALAGISDIRAFINYRLNWTGYNSKSFSILYWKRYLGGEDGWDDISPLKHIDAIKVPVMLIHGKDDTIVPFEQSDKIYNALNRAGKSVELVTLKAEDHWLSREPTRVQTLVVMVDFILKHNPPSPPKV